MDRPMRTLVLASTSVYRRQLLARLGRPFVTDDPRLDESGLPRESVEDSTARLARGKALACAARHQDALIVGSDQLCTLDGQVSGKPATRQRAIEQLLRSSGRRVAFHTAVALLDTRNGVCSVHLAANAVQFRILSRGQVEDYVDREQPLDCAGAFKCEGLGIALFERIEGDDPNALIGLPLIGLCSLLADAGEPVLGVTAPAGGASSPLGRAE